jgi:hypothetical protein
LIIVSTSFRTKKLGDIRKVGTQYVMPTWNGAELETYLSSQYFAAEHSRRLSAEMARCKAAVFGGIIQHILWSQIEIVAAGKEIYCVEMTESIWRNVGYFDNMLTTGLPYDYYDLLLHQNLPLCEKTGNYLFKGMAYYSFASNFVFRKLFSYYSDRLLANAKITVLLGLGTFFNDGHLFKTLLLYYFGINGKEFCATCLIKRSHEHIQVKFPSETELFPVNWNKDPSFKLQPNVLYCPPYRILESGDAFCAVPCPNGHLLMVIVITTERTHTVMGNGLNAIYEKYNASRMKIVNGRLIFFTPTNSLLNVSSQRIPTHKGQEYESEELNLPLHWFHENQYKIETSLEAELEAVGDNLSTRKQNFKKEDFSVYSMFTTAATVSNFPEMAPAEDKFSNYCKEETVIQNLLSGKNKRKLASLDQQDTTYDVPGYGQFFRHGVPSNGNGFYHALAMGLGNVDHCGLKRIVARYIENYPLSFLSELRESFKKQQRSFPLELVLYLEKELKEDPTKTVFRVTKNLRGDSEAGDTTKMESINEIGTTALAAIRTIPQFETPTAIKATTTASQDILVDISGEKDLDTELTFPAFVQQC